MPDSRRLKLKQKIQTQASFLGASFHWLPSSLRHHAGRCCDALQFVSKTRVRAVQRKAPCSASPWQRAGLFPEAVAAVGGARPELQVGVSHLGLSAAFRRAGSGLVPGC